MTRASVPLSQGQQRKTFGGRHTFGSTEVKYMHSKPAGEHIITEHAAFEMERRKISRELVRSVISNPEQRIMIRKGREVFQSRIQMEGKPYLIRVFIDIDRVPAEVVTVYRTRKIEKYWRQIP